MARPIVGRGLAIGDYDNDGRVDILIVDSEGEPLLLHNETANAGNWISCLLIDKTNRPVIGAQINLEAGGRKLLRHCATDCSFLSASDPRVHFGVGTATHVNLTVHWPSRHTTIKRDVEVNRQVVIKE